MMTMMIASSNGTNRRAVYLGILSSHLRSHYVIAPSSASAAPVTVLDVNEHATSYRFRPPKPILVWFVI